MIDTHLLSADREPLPKGLEGVLAVLAVLSIFALHLKSGVETSATGWVVSIVSLGLALWGWMEIERNRSRAGSESDPPTGFHRGHLLFTAGVLIGVVGCHVLGYGVSSSVPLIATYVAALGYDLTCRSRRALAIAAVPIVCGMVFVGAGATLGNPTVGIFPGIIAFLFALVVKVTLDIERDVFTNHVDAPDLEIHHHFRKRLAWTAGAFFLFGVVALWPWLGTIYGHAYFWLIIVGVILPMVFFWGRLRQPRTEGARVALVRFNRISPFIGIILLLSFAIG